MPKRSEIDPQPNDILISEVSGDLVGKLRYTADLKGFSFRDYVLGLIAGYFGIPHETSASAIVIVLDPE